MANSNHIEIHIPAVVEGFHESPFAVRSGDLFRVEHKEGDGGKAFKICDYRGQIGLLLILIIIELNGLPE